MSIISRPRTDRFELLFLRERNQQKYLVLNDPDPTSYAYTFFLLSVRRRLTPSVADLFDFQSIRFFFCIRLFSVRTIFSSFRFRKRQVIVIVVTVTCVALRRDFCLFRQCVLTRNSTIIIKASQSIFYSISPGLFPVHVFML